MNPQPPPLGDIAIIITRTPYRVSFFGGGTDYPAWFREHGGEVLTSTLAKFCYLSVREMPPFLGTKYRVFWSKAEAVDRIEDIQHAGVRGCLQYMNEHAGIEINHAGDLPARSGLGSSSAFTVGMLLALHTLRERVPSADQLAEQAITVEQDVLHETVGVQDQIACAHGGFNHIVINRDGSYRRTPVDMEVGARRQLQKNLMLFFTGIQRHASEIAESQMQAKKTDELHAIRGLVRPALDALMDGEIDEFGRLLHTSWHYKRELSDKVSNPEINNIYIKALGAGALGGKVLGAGGGGFMLFYVPPHRQEAVRAALSPLIDIPFSFGMQGSRVILHEGG